MTISSPQLLVCYLLRPIDNRTQYLDGKMARVPITWDPNPNNRGKLDIRLIENIHRTTANWRRRIGEDDGDGTSGMTSRIGEGSVNQIDGDTGCKRETHFFLSLDLHCYRLKLSLSL